ncbi:MAG TPA: M56 and MltD domain-containing protein [Steroidobacteraceae bacterium]
MAPWEMSGLTIANLYLCANLLLVAAAGSLAAIRALSASLPRPLTYRHLLVMGRVLGLTALLAPPLALWRGGSGLSPLRAQVWSAPSMHAGTAAVSGTAQIELGLNAQHVSLSLNALAGSTSLLFVLGVFIAVWPLLSEARATLRAVRNAHLLRRLGRVRVLVSDREHVPFAIWIPGHCLIVLPAALLLRPADLRLALRHEAQHHRARDTRYLYVMLLGRALFGLNPAVHWLTRQLFELQEFACDEELARRKGHCARAYCSCLLRVAESTLATKQGQLRSFMTSHHGFALARRIEAALQRPARPLRAPAATGIGVLGVALLAILSAASATPVRDRRLSRSDAERLEAATQGSSAFPLKVNDAVLRQLNLLLGTPDGRAFLNSSIARMRDFQPGIRQELKRHVLPTELLAVPLVESGYRNLAPKVGPGAGLWMFVAPTARANGLKVSADWDQRLDVRAETQAAMHLLSDLQRRFRDWPLALMAYNSGIARVQAGIEATRSRDAWTLYRLGYGNDPDYLARTMAVILILANPRLLD